MSSTEERRKIAREASKMLVNSFEYCIDHIWLFGSVARGEDKRNSDIDIACLVNSGMFPTDYEDTPFETHPKVKEIEGYFRKKGYELNIHVELTGEFEKNLRESLIGDKNDRLEQDMRLYLNIYEDKRVLYGGRDNMLKNEFGYEDAARKKILEEIAA